MTSLNASQDIQLARLLAYGLPYKDAGSVLGISKSTVSRRMQDEQFRRSVMRKRVERVDNLLGRLTETAERALTLLDDAVADPEIDMRDRVRAAHAVLGHFRGCVNAAIRHDREALSEEEATELLRERLMELREQQLEAAREGTDDE